MKGDNEARVAGKVGMEVGSGRAGVMGAWCVVSTLKEACDDAAERMVARVEDAAA